MGDVRVDESKVSGLKTLSLEMLLFTEGGMLIARQTIPTNGRYNFFNLGNGRYDIVIQVEGVEVARVRAHIFSPTKTDFRQDIALEWRPGPFSQRLGKSSTVSAEDYYNRKLVNIPRFEKGQQALDNKDYEKAVLLFKQVVTDDPNDFEAWSELGTAELTLHQVLDAENDYLRAIAVHPTYFLALMNLGRIRILQNHFKEALEPLDKALVLRPSSAEANFYLGEAYLQMKKGSTAVGYLNQALKLDPIGKADAHLHLAALYNGAGLKEKAALEYAQFLKKRPDYPDKKKLQDYISQNTKP